MPVKKIFSFAASIALLVLLGACASIRTENGNTTETYHGWFAPRSAPSSDPMSSSAPGSSKH